MGNFGPSQSLAAGWSSVLTASRNFAPPGNAIFPVPTPTGSASQPLYCNNSRTPDTRLKMMLINCIILIHRIYPIFIITNTKETNNRALRSLPVTNKYVVASPANPPVLYIPVPPLITTSIINQAEKSFPCIISRFSISAL